MFKVKIFRIGRELLEKGRGKKRWRCQGPDLSSVLIKQAEVAINYWLLVFYPILFY